MGQTKNAKYTSNHIFLKDGHLGSSYHAVLCTVLLMGVLEGKATTQLFQ